MYKYLKFSRGIVDFFKIQAGLLFCITLNSLNFKCLYLTIGQPLRISKKPSTLWDYAINIHRLFRNYKT